MKALVVDGDKRERRAIVEAIASLDSVAVQGAVPDLASAIRILATETTDLVVTGLELADGDGLQLIAAVRQIAPTPAIVVVGRNSSREEWRRHLAAGADRFVDEDSGLRELKDVIAALARDTTSDSEKTLRLIDPPDGGPPDVRAVDLGTLVRDTMNAASAAISRRVDVRLDIADGVRPVHGSASELEQLVLDLVLDANSAMPDGGTLVVRVAATPTAVILEVSDTSRGAQARELAGVLAIVRRYQAKIQVVGRVPEGTIVRVLLPCPGVDSTSFEQR